MHRIRRRAHIAAIAVLLTVLAASGASAPADKPASRPVTRPAGGDEAAEPATKPVKTKAGITLSRETTYITGPLNDDGTVNYVEYLNNKYSKGVTPENNAAVLMLEAIGTEGALATKIRDEALRRIGAATAPARGLYVSQKNYLSSRSELGEVTFWAFTAQCDQTMDGPWSAEDYPLVADWLEVNKTALKRVISASRRAHFYVPHLCQEEPPAVVHMLMPAFGRCRSCAKALVARAMLKWDSHDYRGAWADLMAVRRLARLMGQARNCTTHENGLLIEGIGTEAMLRLVTADAIPAGDAKHLLADLTELGAFADINDSIANLRFRLLDTVMLLSRGESLDGLAEKPKQRWATEASVFDWNQMLRRCNQYWDQYAACADKETYEKRRDAFRAFERRWDEYMDELYELGDSRRARQQAVANFAGSLERRTELFTKLLFSALLPTFRAHRSWHARQTACGEMTLTATALAVHRAETGKFPEKLAELTPKLLEEVPTDPFTGKPLIYRRTAEGYVLYSVGPDLEDDDGTEGEHPDEGDLVVRVPAAVEEKDE